MTPERVVDLRPRTILRVLLIVLAVAITLEVVWIARHVLAWVVIALFLALWIRWSVGSSDAAGSSAARRSGSRTSWCSS